jgi:hypothetical protein
MTNKATTTVFMPINPTFALGGHEAVILPIQASVSLFVAEALGSKPFVGPT